MKRQERIKAIKEKRREDILSAAAELFAKSGYHLTDVEVIADKLGVGKGTIYRYFPTKEKLFTAVMEQMMHNLSGIIMARTENITNPQERLRAVFRAHIEFFENNMGLLEIFVHYRSEYKDKARVLYLKHYGAGFRKTQELLQECIDQGLIKDVSSARIAASILIDIFYGMLFTTFLGVSRKTFREKGRYLETLLLGRKI